VSSKVPDARARRGRHAPWPVAAVVAAGLMVVLAACTGTRSGPPTPSAKAAATSVTSSANPDFIRVVVPPGLVQDGTLDAKTDWVTPFEQQSGCLVKLTTESTDADAYHDVAEGSGRSFYSAVLASPELAGELIGAKAVAPLDTKHISGYSRVSPRLASAAPEMSGTTAYGLPYLWDSYVTGYDAGKVKPAPDTWTSLFSPSSAKAYAGKITVPQAPVTLALAALYLKSSQPALGITDPFELTSSQLTAAQHAVEAVRPDIGTYWHTDSAVIGQLGDGQDVLGAVLTHQINEMTRAGLPTAGVPALTQAAGSGTAVAYLDSWLVTSHAPNSSCTYKWLSWMTSDYVQERASAFTNAAPVVPAACAGPAAQTCATYHMSSLPSARNIVFEHLPATSCGGSGGCASYADWQTAWKRVTDAAGVVPLPTVSPSAG
jgi:putative spermidine/putrescine transport system substrate-binding protein